MGGMVGGCGAALRRWHRAERDERRVLALPWRGRARSATPSAAAIANMDMER